MLPFTHDLRRAAGVSLSMCSLESPEAYLGSRAAGLCSILDASSVTIRLLPGMRNQAQQMFQHDTSMSPAARQCHVHKRMLYPITVAELIPGVNSTVRRQYRRQSRMRTRCTCIEFRGLISGESGFAEVEAHEMLSMS